MHFRLLLVACCICFFPTQPATATSSGGLFSINGLYWGMTVELLQNTLSLHREDAKQTARSLLGYSQTSHPDASGLPFSTEYKFMGGGLYAVNFLFTDLPEADELPLILRLEGSLAAAKLPQLEDKLPCAGFDQCVRSVWLLTPETKIILFRDKSHPSRAGLVYSATGKWGKDLPQLYRTPALEGHDAEFLAALNAAITDNTDDLFKQVRYIPQYTENSSEVWGALVYAQEPSSPDEAKKAAIAAALIMERVLTDFGVNTFSTRFICQSYLPEQTLPNQPLRVFYGTASYLPSEGAPEWNKWNGGKDYTKNALGAAAKTGAPSQEKSDKGMPNPTY